MVKKKYALHLHELCWLPCYIHLGVEMNSFLALDAAFSLSLIMGASCCLWTSDRYSYTRAISGVLMYYTRVVSGVLLCYTGIVSGVLFCYTREISGIFLCCHRAVSDKLLCYACTISGVLLYKGASGIPLCYTKVVCGVLQRLKQWRPAAVIIKVALWCDELVAVLAF
jgi:hypothetical protein